MLVDHANAQLDGVTGRVDLHLPEVAIFSWSLAPWQREIYLARVRPVQAREDVHQRALASAVLAQQGVDLASAHLQVHVVVGDYAGEVFDDAAHFDGRGER